MKLGIYLAFTPDQPLINQGISRLLAFFIKGAEKLDTVDEIVVAIPHWAMKDFNALIDDHHISKSNLTFLATRGDPFWLRIRKHFNKRLTIKGRGWGVSEKIINFWVRSKQKSFRLTLDLVSSNNFSELMFYVIRKMPLIMIYAFLIPLVSIAIKTLNFTSQNVKKYLKVFLKLVKVYEMLSAPANIFRRNISIHKLYYLLHEIEMKKVIKKINGRSDISAWYVPTMFWEEVKYIKSPLVIAAPDFVQIDFPSQFSEDWGRNAFDRCKNTIEHASRLICYSEYVRDFHLEKRLGIEPKRVDVIYNSSVDMSVYLAVVMSKHGFKTVRCAASYILSSYRVELVKKSSGDSFLNGFELESSRYVFYSSQVRPHKNMRNLILAFHYLLRKYHICVKLVLTAKLEYAPEIMQLISDLQLDREILCFYDVSSEVLSALNCLADVAVSPTLFEGGFPIFTFSEAYSVGTPVVMSYTPVVAERYEKYMEWNMVDAINLREFMFFNPDSAGEMALKIKWALENTDKLFHLQSGFNAYLNKETWEMVAEQYVNSCVNATCSTLLQE